MLTTVRKSMSCKDVQNVPIHHSEETKSRRLFEVTLLNFYSLLRVKNVKKEKKFLVFLISKCISFDSVVNCSFDWLHDGSEGTHRVNILFSTDSLTFNCLS